MTASRPPKLTRHSSPQELKRASQQIRRAQGLTVDSPLRMAGGPTGFHLSLDRSGDWFLARLTSAYTLTANDVASSGAYYGWQQGTVLYAFVEQLTSQANAVPMDNAAGRFTILNALTQHPQSSFAIEVNNTSLTVPGTTPAGYTNAGPYVEMRLKGLVRGVPVYEFQLTLPELAFVSVTSSTAYTIYLGRSVGDVVLVSGSNVISSATAKFTSADVGAVLVSGPAGSPDGAIPLSPPTTIQSVTNATTAIMSANAAASKTSETVAIATGSTLGFSGGLDYWNHPTGSTHTWSFSAGAFCWFLTTNSPDPNTAASPHNVFPFEDSAYPLFQGRSVGNDAYGNPIYSWTWNPGEWFDVAASTAPGYMSNGSVVVYGMGSNPSTGGSSTARVTCGNGSLLFGAMADNGTTYGADLYVAPGSFAIAQNVAEIPYMGDTGQDAVGNQFVNGINVSIGGNTSSLGTSDYGTWSS